MSVTIRKLNENDWQAFAGIRLKALQTDPQVFGSNYEYESGFVEEDWRSRLRNEDSAVFMLYDGEKPFGITGVAISRDDPTGKTAIFWGSWLEPVYRGKGISKLMYETRIDWAKAQPLVERIVVSHRASNVASKYANQKHGFRFTHNHQKTWHDGITEDEVCYELVLKGEAKN